MQVRHIQQIGIAVAMFATAGCGSQPTGPTTPSLRAAPSGTGAVTASPGPTQQTSGVRTVLSPLGLNVRSSPSTSAASAGAAAQGAELTVLGFSADSGGWYHVQGATTTGWITADATLSAPGSFETYSSTPHGFSILFPVTWTFAEETGDVAIRPQSGPDSLVIRSAANVQALGALGDSGYTYSSDTAVVVCGVTGDLLTYDQNSAATSAATPISSADALQKHLAQIRLTLDASHALGMDFNYADASDLITFGYLYNSMKFPFPQCEQ